MTTNIEWVRNPDGTKGESWPVVTGCSHAGGPGCDMCYAARMAATRLKHHPRYEGLATIENGKAKWTGEVRLNHDVLEQPLHWVKPRMVFAASMGDWLHHDVPELFIYRILDVTQRTPQHIYQFLTKRADRLPVIIEDWMLDRGLRKPPRNIWLGVSVENQAAADERIPWLLRTPGVVHYVSVEPYLSAVDLSPWLPGYIYKAHGKWIMNTTTGRDLPPLSWVICGGESGPGARPMHPDWARSLRNQCQAAGTPYFFKQWGAWLHVSQQSGQSLSGPHHWWGKETLEAKDISYRVGKKRAGHLLDGRTWQEFPVSTKVVT